MGGPGGEQNWGIWCELPKVSIKKIKRKKKEKISPSGWSLGESVAVSLSMVDVRASSLLWAMLSLGWWSCEAEESTLRKKAIEYKPGSSIPPLSLLKFLPPGSSPGYLLLVLFLCTQKPCAPLLPETRCSCQQSSCSGPSSTCECEGNRSFPLPFLALRIMIECVYIQNSSPPLFSITYNILEVVDFFNRGLVNRVWWYMPEIPALGRLRQEDYVFKASIGYQRELQATLRYMRPCHEKEKKKLYDFKIQQ